MDRARDTLLDIARRINRLAASKLAEARADRTQSKTAPAAAAPEDAPDQLPEAVQILPLAASGQ